MKRLTLLCASAVAFGLANAQAFAQSDRESPTADRGTVRETGPSSPSNTPAERMENGPAQMDKSGPSEPGMKKGSQSDASDKPSSRKDGKDNAKSDRGTQDKSTGRAAETDPQKDTGKDADNAASGKSEGTAGANDGAPNLSQLPAEQRTKVQSSFKANKSQAVVRDLNVSINVGVALPRTVTMYAIPNDIVVIVPAYREYKYFVYEEKVVIVDPSTFEIVEIIILT